MDSSERDIERASLTAHPTSGVLHEWGIVCPECGQVLPVDAQTECDRCGAHLRLLVETVVPAIDGGDGS